MSKLGVQLSVDDFESYRAKMLDAQRIAIDTKRVIDSAGRNPTFGSYGDMASQYQKVTENAQRAATAAKNLADKQIAEANRAADGIAKANARARDSQGRFVGKGVPYGPREVAVGDILGQTAAARRSQDAFLGATAESLSNIGSQASRVAPQIARAREEQEKLNRAAEAYNRIQGGGRSSSALTGEQKYGRINLARQGADVFTQLGSGHGLGITAIQQGPQIIEAMALSGGKFSAAMTAAAAAAGPIALAAAGVVAVGYTANMVYQDLTAASRQRLLVETRIQEVLKKQSEEARRARADLDAASERAASQFKYNNWADKATTPELQRRLALLNTFIGNKENPDQRMIDQYGSERLDIEARLRSRALQDSPEVRTEAMNARFANDWENWKKQQAGQAEAARKFAEDVTKGREKVVELGKVWRETLLDTAVRSYNDNPFVKIFVEGRSEMEKFKEGIRGLPKDMQASLIASQQAITGRALFSARVDNAMNAFDLRELAASFRNAGDTRFTPKDIDAKEKLQIDGKEFEVSKYQYQFGVGGRRWVDATRDQVDPSYKYTGGAGDAFFNRLLQTAGTSAIGPRFSDIVGGFEGFARRQFDNLDAMNAGSALNRSSLASVLAREKLSPDSNFGSPAEKLDRQLAALDRLDPKNAGEQAILDQRILRTASGIDPSQINSGTRERLAQIADRAADREERKHQEAQDVRKQMAASLKMISGEEKKLNDEVGRTGSQAIEIRLKNETSDLAAEVSRPTQEDTERVYRQYQGQL